jgi:hypothetical protein
VAKVKIAEKHPSGAKARHFLSSTCGTTEVVPFQNPTFTTGCKSPDDEFKVFAARLKSCPVTRHAKDCEMVSFSAACKARVQFT